ncbi:MAG TPA: exonuclease subunit SbcD [Gemmataceae bacterium]|jgi:exonuclease SbcD|nr:exonuclease subunit SbcD [Gemmataceae bacterium]
MRVLHTADWHLADRLGRIDRTDDLRKAVERVATYCTEQKIDVLLVAGDLFSELAGPDALREAIRHLQETFGPFLRDGGTILTLTGNHDKENFCQTLRHAMSLAAPLAGKSGDRAQPGRLYLATGPTLLRLADRSGGGDVQFVLMPYPTPTRYLSDEAGQRYQGLDEKNRHLMAAFTQQLHGLQTDRRFDPSLQTVLSAHVAVQGCQLGGLFRLSEQEDVILADADLPAGFAYVALGHIHKAQCLANQRHVRYSGSIERMDLGESRDDKGVVVFDLGPEGLRGDPEVLPIDATPVYEVTIHAPKEELPGLRETYKDAQRHLVKVVCTYTAGVDNREETLRQLEEIFPRWYDRQITEKNALRATLTGGDVVRTKSFEETVRDYLTLELTNEPDDLRDAVLARAEALMGEVQA